MASKRRTDEISEVPESEATTLTIREEMSAIATDFNAECDAAVTDILRTSCEGLEQNHRSCTGAALQALHYALKAGKFACIIKNTVGHGNFQAYCQHKMPHVSFRRIQQYMWLASNEDELRLLLRAENAHHASPLTDDEVLATTSIRKAQRMLTGATAEVPTKAKRKKRQRIITATPFEGERDDLLTPSDIVAAASELFGRIDLDPCGAPKHLNHIPATECLTPDDDGLSDNTPWHGRAFIHPPLSKIGEWTAKAIRYYEAGSLDEALLFLPAETDAIWFHQLAGFPRAFLRKRPNFKHSEAASSAKAHVPYLLVFMGPHERITSFADVFSFVADVFIRHSFT